MKNADGIRPILQSAKTREAYNEPGYGLKLKKHEEVAKSIHDLFMGHEEWDILEQKDVTKALEQEDFISVSDVTLVEQEDATSVSTE
ncbi:hypothetical protein JQC92_17895 [Shewanella sp. 202IG2-18]|uniref:hypothetical protein n=1 Tax=Parashewanella hymeniacidonis TaxID=2807618 RepID=UPI001960D8A5|nr:hypothetical protein [Parashewanella hymeniacidonis]MBM7073883.1 hypothetical protein [Parashewanella hymeniacidonis]